MERVLLETSPSQTNSATFLETSCVSGKYPGDRDFFSLSLAVHFLPGTAIPGTLDILESTSQTWIKVIKPLSFLLFRLIVVLQT